MRLGPANILLLAPIGVVLVVSALERRLDIVLIAPRFEELVISLVTFTFLLWVMALMAHGRDRAQARARGGFHGRLKRGAFWVILTTGAGLVFLSVAGFYEAWPPASINGAIFGALMLGGLGVFGAHSVAIAMLARLSWDDKQVTATTVLLGQKTHNWNDLRQVVDSSYSSETHLHFRGSGKARISYFYEGHDEVVRKALEVLNNA